MFFSYIGILKAGESRLGKIVKEKVVRVLGPKKAQGIDVVLKDSSYRYQNGISMSLNNRHRFNSCFLKLLYSKCSTAEQSVLYKSCNFLQYKSQYLNLNITVLEITCSMFIFKGNLVKLMLKAMFFIFCSRFKNRNQ